MSSFSSFLVLFGLSAVSTYSHAATRELVLADFGFGKTKISCEESLTQVANEFSRTSGASVISQGCVWGRPGDRFGAGIITYISSSRLPIFESQVRSTSQADGYYYSLADCNSGLSQEVSFLRNQGLQVIAGYCIESSVISRPLYSPNIYAHGVLTNYTKQALTTRFPVEPASEAKAEQDISDMVSARGFLISHDALPLGGDRYSAEVYVGVERPAQYLAQWSELGFGSVEECEAASSDLQSQWSDASTRPAGVCSAYVNKRSQLMLVGLSSRIFGFDHKLDELPQRYATVADCTNDKARVRDLYEAHNKQVLGMVCGINKSLTHATMAVMY